MNTIHKPDMGPNARNVWVLAVNGISVEVNGITCYASMERRSVSYESCKDHLIGC